MRRCLSLANSRLRQYLRVNNAGYDKQSFARVQSERRLGPKDNDLSLKEMLTRHNRSRDTESAAISIVALFWNDFALYLSIYILFISLDLSTLGRSVLSHLPQLQPTSRIEGSTTRYKRGVGVFVPTREAIS